MADAPIPIRLFADYVEWPLWAVTGPLSERDLLLSTDLHRRIQAWFSAYDHPRDGWPLWTPPPGLAPDEVEGAWAAEAEAIGEQLQAELGPGYAVTVEF
jgi:hypothetical protein